jgi:hypothetical protein
MTRVPSFFFQVGAMVWSQVRTFGMASSKSIRKSDREPARQKTRRFLAFADEQLGRASVTGE